MRNDGSSLGAPFAEFDYHWQAAKKAAGITDFHFHDLRHTCASLLAMNGASLLEIAHVLGHKSITMTQRYSHLCNTHKAKLTDQSWCAPRYCTAGVRSRSCFWSRRANMVHPPYW